MFTRKVCTIITVGLVFSLLMACAAIAVESVNRKKPISQGAEKPPAGGGGGSCVTCTQAAGKPPQRKDKTNLLPAKIARRSVGTNRHVLAAPEKFPKDGVYLWCDPDGVWTVFWRNKEKVAVGTTVNTTEPITVKAAVKAEVGLIEGQQNKVEISGDSKSRIGIVQFSSESDSVDFDILIDGKIDSSKVFVGSLLANPTRFPVKLAIRRILLGKVARTARLTNRQRHAVLVNLTEGQATTAKQAPSPSPGSHGGGGGRHSKTKVEK